MFTETVKIATRASRSGRTIYIIKWPNGGAIDFHDISLLVNYLDQHNLRVDVTYEKTA